jgi:hypothetical protein
VDDRVEPSGGGGVFSREHSGQALVRHPDEGVHLAKFPGKLAPGIAWRRELLSKAVVESVAIVPDGGRPRRAGRRRVTGNLILDVRYSGGLHLHRLCGRLKGRVEPACAPVAYHEIVSGMAERNI